MNTQKPIPDAISIPQVFVDAHINHIQLAQLLGWTQEQFWTCYLAGAVPQGVPMLTVLGVSWLVWPRADIEAWMDAGQPVDEDLADRTKRVIAALRDAIEGEYGRPLEELAETINSRN